MTTKTTRSDFANEVKALIRIYRAATRSGDTDLAQATALSLERYGVSVASLIEVAQ